MLTRPLGSPEQDEIENPPVSIVAPGDMNIDPSTMRFDPGQYLSMAGDALMNLLSPQSANAQEAPVEQPLHVPHPDAQPLLTAIDSGYADKKIIKPVDMIREGVQSGNEDLIKKGHRKLIDLFLGDRSFGEWYTDTFLRSGSSAANAQKMAGEVVMNELMRPGSIGGPPAEEAVRMGLVSPNELNPGSQLRETSVPYTIPAGSFEFAPSGDVAMKPITTQKSQTELVPNARLSPFQQGIVESRQKAIQSGLAYKAALAQSRGILADEKAQTERVNREQMLPAKLKAMAGLDALREAQVGLTNARTEWYKQLPGLRRELSGGSSPLEIEALKRVHEAIKTKQPIEKADWLIANRWLRKGSPQFSVDFMGRAFDRLTGQSERKGGAFGWLGLPEPPATDLDESQHAEVQAVDEDLIHQFGSFIGSLIQGIKPGGTETKPVDKPKAGLSTEEKAELERLRKKHGRK